MTRWIATIVALWLATAAGPARAGVEAAIAAAMPAVLELRSADDGARFLGSGLVWSDGRIGITNAHVLDGADRVEVRFRDGTRTVAKVRARDPVRDIALLDLPGGFSGLTPVTDWPDPGTPVIALGAPMGLGFTATSGIVSATPRQVDANVPLRLLQHDAALNPGSSGGPLIDSSGRLVGMNAQIANGSRLFFGISYAISAADLARLVPMLADGRLPPVPVLGLDLRPVDGAVARALAVTPAGLLIDDVLPGSAAASAGLRPGDILLSASGRDLAEPGDLAFALDTTGTSADLRLLRDGAEIAASIDLSPPGDEPVPQAAGRAPVTLAMLSVRIDGDGRVTGIDPDSAAARGGLYPGDRILRLNGAPVQAGALRSATLAAAFLLLIERDGRHVHLLLDPWADGAAPRPIGGGNSLDLAVVRF